ncbi:MAG TPA: hypothetical protein VGJ92_04860, partial [Methanocella sp.]
CPIVFIIFCIAGLVYGTMKKKRYEIKSFNGKTLYPESTGPFVASVPSVASVVFTSPSCQGPYV